MRPKKRKAVPNSILRGKLIGLKGSWLILESDGKFEAWNTKELMAHVFVPAKKTSKSGLDKFF